MKNRYLPETDIANLAFKPVSQKTQFLASWIRPRMGRGSYNPYRKTYADAVNKQLPLYPDAQIATPWKTLEGLVRKKCHGSELLLSMNLPIASATHSFAVENNVIAEPIHASPITLVPGQQYEFGQPLLLKYNDDAAIMFPDLRRTGQLSPHGRRVAFSVMQERFITNYPEYSGLRKEIWRYKNNEERTIKVHRHDGEPLYNYEQLSADFVQTYEILNYLRLERDVDQKKRGGDDFGPLFGTG